MTTENEAAPGVAADTATPEQIVNQGPEVTTPESETEQQPQEQPEGDKPKAEDRDKSIQRMNRRMDRITAARYQAEARAQELERKLAQYEQRDRPEAEAQQIRPEDIERIATERALQLREMEAVVERSRAIRDALVKEVGQDNLPKLLEVVTEEAGPLVREDQRWTPLGEAIADSDDPAKLIAYLGQNPEAAESLRGLSAAQLGRRIARIELQMKAPEPKPSKAPKPLEPLKGSADIQKDPTEMSQAEFTAWRRSQIANRR